MKKEKTIRTYQRRTKTGKIVTVRQHTAKYDAAEALKKAAKYGAGDELEALKEKLKEKPKKNTLTKEELEALDKEYEAYLKGKKHPMSFDEWRAEKGRSIKSSSKVLKTPKASKAEKTLKSDSSYGFTADEYKAWYHWDQEADPKNKAALKVEKALKAKMGAKGYKKYFDEMSDSYSSRGHNKAYKALGAEAMVPKKDAKTPKSKVSNIYGGMTKEEFEKRQRDFTKRVKDADKGTRAKYSFTDIKKKIKEADISDAARKRLLKSINKPYAVVTPAVMEKRLQKELDKSSSKGNSGTTDNFKGHPKVMSKIDKLISSYQKDIERVQKHIDAGDVRPGGTGSRRMSYKEQKKYAEKQIKELEKGREAHLAGKENKAWGHLRKFVGFNENNIIGKETRAKNKVAAEKKQQKRENDRIKQAQLHAQRVAESVEKSRKTREAMSGAKRIPADLLKKATAKSRNGKHPVTSIYHGDKTLVEIGGTYYRVTKAEMKDISAAMPSKPAKRHIK